MADANKSTDEDKKIPERPLDPTRDAEDVLGDPSGRIGVTTGDSRQISAEPDEVDKDESVLPGGVINDPTKVNPGGIERDTEDDVLSKKETIAGMSDVRATINRDLASEEEEVTDALEEILHEENDDTPARGPAGSDPTRDPGEVSVDASGEETASGSAPDPETIPDDAGSLQAQYTGNDPDPDMNDPKEVNIAEEVDKDERAIEES